MKRIKLFALALLMLAVTLPVWGAVNPGYHLFFGSDRWWNDSGQITTDGVIKSKGADNGLILSYEQNLTGRMSMDSVGKWLLDWAIWKQAANATNYYTITQAAAGGVTLDSVSSGTAGFTFSDPITFKGSGSYNTTFQAGAASASKTYTLPLTDGTAGYGLTTNGSAVLSWSPVINLTSLSSTATGLTYTNTTGAFSLTTGYMIPGGGLAGQILTSAGTSAPAWTTATYPATATTTGNTLIADGTNWTSANVLSAVPTGLTYTSSTRAVSLTSGYVIPTTTEETNWNGVYGGVLAGPVGITTENITVGSGTGLTVNSTGNVNRQVYKVTLTYAGLSAAALTADKVIATLPAKTKLVAIYADTTVAYTGGAVSAATLCVGKTTGGVEYIATHDVFTAAVVVGLADADMGTSMTRAAAIQGGDLPSWTATTGVSVRLTTVTANTNALTAGSTTYYLVCERY